MFEILNFRVRYKQLFPQVLNDLKKYLLAIQLRIHPPKRILKVSRPKVHPKTRSFEHWHFYGYLFRVIFGFTASVDQDLHQVNRPLSSWLN
jgi:hypothetical protein